jgi:hypothetical protein
MEAVSGAIKAIVKCNLLVTKHSAQGVFICALGN